ILTGTGDAVAGPVGDVVELLAPGFGYGLTHGQGGTRGGIYFIAVMGLKDLGIKSILHELRCDFDQPKGDIHADTHVRSKYNGDVFGSAGDGSALFVRKTGSTNNALGPVLLAGGQVPHGALWQGEINEAICLFEGSQVIGQ